jgi:propionyl-CoA synthetase
VFWAASDVGWVVGHSYIVYAPLLHGCTTILYEGKPVGTPDAGAFWRVIEQHKVGAVHRAHGVPRHQARGSQGRAPEKRYDTSKPSGAVPGRRALRSGHPGVGGEILGVPVIDHWWQTETGWAIAANCLGLERCRSKRARPPSRCRAMTCRCSTTTAAGGRPATSAHHDQAAAAAGLPADPVAERRALRRVLPGREPGYYLSGDAGYMDDDGYLFVMSRIDDIINVAGHRLSTGGMEEVLAAIRTWPSAPSSASPTAQGRAAAGAGGAQGRRRAPDAEIGRQGTGGKLVREQIGPVAAFKTATGGRAAAQDPLRQDPARHHEEASPRAQGVPRCRPPSTIRPSWTRSTTARNMEQQMETALGMCSESTIYVPQAHP